MNSTRSRSFNGSARHGVRDSSEQIRDFPVVGKDRWKIFFGMNHLLGKTCTFADPPLSHDELISACPFYPDERVGETHLAFRGLRMVNGLPASLQVFQSYWKDAQWGRQWIEQVFSDEEVFAAQTVCVDQWYLVPRNPFDWCHGQALNDQLDAIPKGYVQSTAIEAVFAYAALQKTECGNHFQRDRYLLCSDRTRHKYHLLLSADARGFHFVKCASLERIGFDRITPAIHRPL